MDGSPSETGPGAATRAPARLVSLDALRGFDMFWIVGGNPLLLALLVRYRESYPWLHEHIVPQTRHIPWHGFTLHDLIFPLFIFIAGAAISLSLSRRLDQGLSRGRLCRQALRRALILIALGWVYNGILRLPGWENMRFGSVLGRIGTAYFFAALIYIFADLRHRIVWAIGLLLGYYAAMRFIAPPGGAAGDFSIAGNVASFLDRAFMPGRLYQAGRHDPEGIFSSIPAIAGCLTGTMAGDLLRYDRIKPLKKVLVMCLAGVVFLLVAKLWHTGFRLYPGFFNPFDVTADAAVIGNAWSFPINKNIWTSSFVLHTTGWSLLLLSAFYLALDIGKLRRLGFFFVVIGVNPITIYMGRMIFNFNHTSNYLFGGLIQRSSEPWQGVLRAAGYVLSWWVILLLLYRKKIFLKV